MHIPEAVPESSAVTDSLPCIALLGKMGAGKTTIAEILEADYRYLRIPIAAELKSVAQRIWGEGAATDRDKLQRLGVAVREIDADAWINSALTRMDYLCDPRRQTFPRPGRFVVDDVRFPNEYWALKERGFIMIRVVCDEERRVDRLIRNGKLQDMSQLEHESEKQLDDAEVDFTIENIGSFFLLQQRVGDVLHAVRSRA